MKKIILIFFFTGISSLFINCNKNDDNTPQHPINGSWNLKNVSGGIVGLDLNYDTNEVVWVFNEKTNTLEVQNNITTTGPKSIYAGLATGTYSYEIKIKNKEEELYINNNKQGVLKIANETLSIDEGVIADGFLFRYSK